MCEIVPTYQSSVEILNYHHSMFEIFAVYQSLALKLKFHFPMRADQESLSGANNQHSILYIICIYSSLLVCYLISWLQYHAYIFVATFPNILFIKVYLLADLVSP